MTTKPNPRKRAGKKVLVMWSLKRRDDDRSLTWFMWWGTWYETRKDALKARTGFMDLAGYVPFKVEICEVQK